MDGEKETSPRPPAPRRRLRFLWGATRVIAVSGVLLAVALWLGWRALGLYPEAVSGWLSRGVGQRVSITSIQTRWEGTSPRLTLHGVTLLDPRPGHHERALARFASLDVLVDPWASVRSGSFRPAAVTVHGASLMLIRHPDGSLDVRGMRDEPALARGPDALARLFLEHAQVSMRSSRLLWVDRSELGGPVSVRDVDLHLRSVGERRHIVLSGTIEDPGSGTFRVELQAEGNLLTASWSGEATLNARDLDLEVAARIFGVAGAGAVEGLATLDLSGLWRAGRMESAHGRFRLRDATLELGTGSALLPETSGAIEIETGRGALSVDSGVLEWDWPEVFHERLAVSDLSGRADWRRDGDAIRVHVPGLAFENPHLAGSLDGRFDWSKDDPEPVLALRVRLARGDLSHLPEYLPAGTLHPDLTAWIARAIRGGRLDEGEVRIEGALRDWPFNGEKGSVSARARVSGVELRYARGWPGIEELGGELRFEGRRAELRLSGGRVQGAEITRARLEIPHIGDGGATLHIDGELAGTTGQAADFLRNSPLAPRFREVLDRVDAQGPADLALRMALPLPAGPKRVSGELAVRDNRVDLPGLDEGLEGVTGVISFEGAALDAERVEALYLGRPITLRITPRGSEGGVRIEAEGSTTREHLAAHLRSAGVLAHAGAGPPAWLSRLHGETRWRGVLDLEKRPGAPEALAAVRISSDLQGAGIDLPPPLTKAPVDSVPLEIEIRFQGGGARSLRARYGGLLSSVFALRDRNAAEGRLARGTIQLGGGDEELPDLPEEEGVTVSGTLPHLSLGAWTRLLRAGARSGGAAGSPAPPALGRVRRLNLQVDALEAFGVPFGTTRIDARAEAPSAWTAALVGANVVGEVRIAAGPEPLRIHMDRLIVPGPAAGEEGEQAPSAPRPDPRALPALHFTCAECKLGDRALGALDIVTRPDPHGARVPSFYMRGEGYEAKGSGAWLVSGGAHQSSVDAEVHSNDLGRLLGTFEHVESESITGATDMLLEATWPGSPFDFDLGRLDGTLHFRASEGRLTQVRRGATGRLFGLLMLPSLPRRLVLDFRDLFQEGLAFDLMEGSFAIRSGDAYTNNFVIESPTATIELAGRTGLIDEDYDHVLTLTPRLTESIALLPIWLGEKILNTRIFDRVFAHRYTIRGPWSAPRTEPVQSEAQPSQRQ